MTLRRVVQAAERWAGAGLSERQLAALALLDDAGPGGRLTNAEYQRTF